MKTINTIHYSLIQHKEVIIPLVVIEEYKKFYLVKHPAYGEIEVMKDESGDGVRFVQEIKNSKLNRLALVIFIIATKHTKFLVINFKG